MIHLDRGHPSIAARPQSNLILADPNNHADHNSVLSWSPSSRKDHSFYHEHQEPFAITPDQAKPTIQTDAAAPVPAIPPAIPGPITPADAEEPKLPGLSPSSPANARSPLAESTSSLTPPPDTATPSALADHDNTDGPPGDMTTEGKDEHQAEAKGETVEEVDRASRQSTPLSELSSVEDVPDNETKGEEKATSGSAEDRPAGSEASREAAGQDKAKDAGSTGNTQGGAPSSKVYSPREALAETSSSGPDNNALSGPSNTQLSSSSDLSSSLASLFGQHDVPVFPRDPSTPGQLPSLPSASASGSSQTAGHDSKVVAILELNSQLLNVLMGFQTRGLASEEPLRQQYAEHLQSNLTWIAAAADGYQKGRTAVPLPAMQPPPPIDFMPTDRIQQLYADLPSIFAKEIARRQQLAAMQTSAAPATPDAVNGKLKRERTDEGMPDMSNKRRDTGETKVATPMRPPAPVTHPSLGPSIAPNLLPNAVSPPAGIPGIPSMSSNPAAHMGSPMAPPSIPQGLMSGVNEVQLAQQRARQMQQMRAMQQQQMQQQQLAEGSRQMSPPSMPQQGGMQMQSAAGPSNMPPLNQLNQGQIAQLQAIGPTAVQNYQILQSNNHPLVNYLTQQFPGFRSLPITQQLQHMAKAQMLLQQRQIQNRQQQQSGGSMQGFMQQPSMQSFPGGGMPNQASRQESPTRVSPVTQQMSPSGDPSTSGFPFPNQPSNNALASLTPQQQAMLASMPPQQRHMWLVQHLRTTAGANANMMSPQMLANQERMRQEQQRIAQQQGMPHNAGPSMGGGMDGNQIAALRSNPTIPGIARNTRTPSDTASPGLPQRISGHSQEDLQRAMLMQQAQQAQHRGMTPQMSQNAGFPQMNWPQGNQAQIPQMGHNQGYGMSPPNSAGSNMGGMAGGRMQSPMPGMQNHWQQNMGNSQFAFGTPSPADTGMSSRQASATPAPQMAMSQNSPGGDAGGLSLGDSFDIFNWEQ